MPSAVAPWETGSFGKQWSVLLLPGICKATEPHALQHPTLAPAALSIRQAAAAWWRALLPTSRR